MSWLSLFFGVAFAAETSVISPLASDWQPPQPVATQPTVFFDQITSLNQEPQILGAQTETTPTPTSKPEVHRTKQKSYTLAFLGDSMVDTLGPNIYDLGSKLREVYPLTNFNLLNYGVGGTNIDYGLERITHDYTYLGKEIPSLVSQKPDVVIVESFGYNPYSDANGALTRHWLAMAAIVDSLRKNLPGVKIIIAASIAPNATVFGDGALNWSPDQKQRKVTEIKSYLENALKFAASQHLPLADVYTPSLDADGNGKLTYINAGDHIHYSDAGRALFTEKVSDAIINNHLLE